MNIKTTAVAALVFVGLYNILFFNSGWGIGTGILFLILNIFFFFVKNGNSRNLNFALFSSALSISFAFLFSLRGNGIVQLMDLTTAIFFSLTALYLYKYNEDLKFQIPKLLLIPLLVIERSIGGLLNVLKEDNSTQLFKKNTTPALIRGLLISIPIFAVLLFLLMQADPIFGRLTQNVFQNIGERVIISSILFTVLTGFGLSRFLEKISDKEEAIVSTGKSHELSIITGSIIGLFAIFIIIQFRYLFVSVGERELHQLGITSLTYSEYVRKGFFELLIAASLASGVIIYIFKYLHKLERNQKFLLQFFSALLTIETGLILLSAIKRLTLYADAHGLTRARVFGFIFLLWLALLLLIFLIKVFKEFKEREFFASTFSVTLIILALINIINIDGLIAQKYKPTVNGEIDYFYLNSISTDAKDSWKESIADTEQIVNLLESSGELSTEDNRKLYWAGVTISELNSKVGQIIDKYGTLKQIRSWQKNGQVKTEADLPADIKKVRKWQAFNFSEYTAYREIVDNLILYEEGLFTLAERIEKLNSKVSEEIRQNTALDRSTNPPLIR